MKTSLVTSSVLHGLVLAWALVSIGSPAQLEVADVEALPVDLVPSRKSRRSSRVTRPQPPAKRQRPSRRSALIPWKTPKNTGDNDVDLKAPPTPAKKPNTEVAAAPEKVDKVLPVKSDETNDIKEVAKEETVTAPATEVAAKAEPPREVTPAPKPEATPAEQPPAERRRKKSRCRKACRCRPHARNRSRQSGRDEDRGGEASRSPVADRQDARPQGR